MSNTDIPRFVGKWGFLSNFYLCPIEMDGLHFASVEHAYQAAKTLDFEARKKFTYDGIQPAHAKRMGRKLKQLRPDWEQVKVAIMRQLLMQKFEPEIRRVRLTDTGAAQLIEGNDWHDTFWGVCDGTCSQGPHEPGGLNMLGQLLMEVRRHG